MKIGIIGYGQMGSGAAYNLNKKHELYIEHEDTMLKYIDNNGFKVIDTHKYDDLDIKDMILVVCQKKI